MRTGLQYQARALDVAGEAVHIVDGLAGDGPEAEAYADLLRGGGKGGLGAAGSGTAAVSSRDRVGVYHPPFPIGIAWMDRIGLLDPEHFVRAIDGARNLRHIFFGHVHRPVSGHWRGISFSTLYGTNHQVLLDLHEPRCIAFTAEPPSYGLVLLDGDRLVIHNEPFLADLRDIRTTAPRA